MSGISTNATNTLKNNFGFNGGNLLERSEFSDGSGLELYDAHFRMYDPQLGRFFQIDKLAELSISISPFVFSHNNPISLNDPLGLDPTDPSDPNYIHQDKDLDEVVISSNRTPEQKVSVKLNNSDYWGVAYWVDDQIKRGVTPDQIWSWAAKNDWLNKSTLWNIQDATNSGAVSWRHKTQLEWEQDAKFAKFIATTIAISTGTELFAMLAEGAEIAAISEGIVESSLEASLAERGILGIGEHALERIAERGFTNEAILKIIDEGVVRGAVYNGLPQIKYILGEYKIATGILGENAGKIITIMGDYHIIGNNGVRGIFTGF